MCLAAMDESGDPGMKLRKGSSQLFTIGLLLFQIVTGRSGAVDRYGVWRGALGGEKIHAVY